MQMPQPTEEHRWLQAHVGHWTVQCEMNAGPGKPPMHMEATDDVAALGAFWVIARFKSDFAGMPYEGCAMCGYDPHAKVFRSTWIDTMNPGISTFEGTRSADGTTIQWKGTSWTPFGPGAHFMAEEITESADKRSFRMWVQMADGSEMPMLHHRYTRVK